MHTNSLVHFFFATDEPPTHRPPPDGHPGDRPGGHPGHPGRPTGLPTPPSPDPTNRTPVIKNTHFILSHSILHYKVCDYRQLQIGVHRAHCQQLALHVQHGHVQICQFQDRQCQKAKDQKSRFQIGKYSTLTQSEKICYTR